MTESASRFWLWTSNLGLFPRHLAPHPFFQQLLGLSQHMAFSRSGLES
jgi:hypothetical protein